MPLLYGEHELTIDEKNRVSIPAEVRKQFNPERDGEAFFAIMAFDRRLWLYPEKYYEMLASRDPGDMTPAEELLAFDRLNFALATKLSWDQQGRMQLTEKTIKRHGLEKQVTLIGVRDHMELWNSAEWNRHRDEELLAKSPEVALLAKKVRKSV